jgi:hypothetical protein
LRTLALSSAKGKYFQSLHLPTPIIEKKTNMTSTQKKIIVFWLLLTPCLCLAQPVSQQLNAYFSSIRKGESASPDDLLKNLKGEKGLVESIIPYQKDTVTSVRYQAYTLLAQIGKRSNNKAERQQAVTQLLTAWQDSDSGTSGVAGSELSSFLRADFSPAAIDSLKALLQRQPAHYSKVVRLVGYLGLRDQIPVIQSHLQTKQIVSSSDKWSAYIALCRLGDPSALTFVMGRVKKLGMNDDVVYEILPDLVYTRQRELIQHMVEALHSNDPTCESSDPENSKPIACGYRIMEMLAPVVKDFPIKSDPSGDLAATDYKKALEQVRQWFKTKGSGYVIWDEGY